MLPIMRTLAVLSVAGGGAAASPGPDLHLVLGASLDLADFPDLTLLSARRLDTTAEQLSLAGAISLPGGGGGGRLERKIKQEDEHDGTIFLEFADDGEGARAEITVDLREGSMVGTAADGAGSAFLILPLAAGGGGHAWAATDQAASRARGASPKAPHATAGESPSGPAAAAGSFDPVQLLERGERDRTTVADVSVKVYYSRDLAGNTIAMHIKHIVSSANRSFARSGVLVRLVLVGTERYLEEESDSNDALLHNFTLYKGSVGELLGSADLAILVVRGGPGVSGLAYTNTLRWPVGVVKLQLALTFHSFVHEVAHIFGAAHDRGQLARDGTAPHHRHGVGYVNGPAGKATIMAYPGPHARIGFFSARGLTDGDGDAVGHADADNARVLNARRFLQAVVGDESAAAAVEKGVGGKWRVRIKAGDIGGLHGLLQDMKAAKVIRVKAAPEVLAAIKDFKKKLEEAKRKSKP